MKKFALITLVIVVAFIGPAGCFGGSKAAQTGASGEETSVTAGTGNEPDSEVGTTVNGTPEDELFFYTAMNKIYEEEENFERLIGQHIRKKFPNIKIKHVHWNDGTRYEDLIAKGTLPDIVLEEVHRNTHRMIEKFQMEYDMSDLIKKYNFDTSRLDPGTMTLVQSASGGKIYSLPFEMDEFALVYNKDIFDKFGEDYPKLGMTYDEAYELTKKMTRQDGDATYKGYQQHPSHYSYYNQLGEPVLDPNEDKASYTTDTWVKIVNNMRRFYEIDGNQFTSTSHFPQGRMAMSVDTIENITKWSREYPDLNFAFGTVPVFPEGAEFEIYAQRKRLVRYKTIQQEGFGLPGDRVSSFRRGADRQVQGRPHRSVEQRSGAEGIRTKCAGIARQGRSKYFRPEACRAQIAQTGLDVYQSGHVDCIQQIHF
ncbi:ABC transporter substrate-binding protein [Paenibacillus alkalitolerans]|uniref:ABC transporter substrate-binding protein n=1 Tax=Paenibacillus alkalitolerans TaxID=2799335 RepID=UPI0018F578F4|nr:extracellular solute-binding protein [Paenibacillus alkalitolerans]